MSTSLITRIKRDTFITFKSGLEDIELFNRSDKKFRFSHFALLNIPDIKEANNNENVSDFERIQSRFITGNSVATPPAFGDSIDLSESLQNYVMNFEELITINENYNNKSLRTTSERIFFKWLKEIGAVRYINASNSVSNNIVTNYTEEDDNDNIGSGNLYTKLVKYIGEVDMQNKNTSNKNNFEEIYVYIPSEVGYTPTILFKTISDDNYKESMITQRSSVVDREYIEGYDSSSSAPSNGLELLAQYDIDVAGLTYASINDVDNSDTSLWFDYYINSDAYLTDKSFSDPSNDEITVTHPTSLVQKTFLRNRLDGVSIDFDKTSYVAFNDMTLKSFNDFNSTNATFGFDFNCIALYYEVEENNIVVRNLYGVMFLDDVVEVSGGQSKIRSLSKIKNSTVLNQSGNSYGFKLNFRIDTTNSNVVVDIMPDVNDYNTHSMQLFAEAVSRMKEISDNYETVVYDNMNLRKKIDEILNFVIERDKTSMVSILESINQKLETSTEFNGLSSLIQKNSDIIADILNNRTKISSELILAVVGNKGIDAKLFGNTLTIALTGGYYNDIIEKEIDVRYNNKNRVEIGYRNRLIYFSSNIDVVEDDISILLDDKNYWETNQSVKIVLSKNIIIGDKTIKLFTDVNSKIMNQSFGFNIGNIKPSSNVIEVICKNKTNYEFIVVG